MDDPGAATPAQALAGRACKGNMSAIPTVHRVGRRTPMVTSADGVGGHEGLEERWRDQPCVATALRRSD